MIERWRERDTGRERGTRRGRGSRKGVVRDTDFDAGSTSSDMKASSLALRSERDGAVSAGFPRPMEREQRSLCRGVRDLPPESRCKEAYVGGSTRRGWLKMLDCASIYSPAGRAPTLAPASWVFPQEAFCL